MSDIFISYASEDRSRVEPLAESLAAQGWSVWWDRHIAAGKNFQKVIQGALDAARCVIVVWTETSVSSDWVHDEAREGANRNVLVPVLFDQVMMPLGLRSIQAADLVDWEGTLPHLGFARLVKDISELIGPPGTRDSAESISKAERPSPKATPVPAPQYAATGTKPVEQKKAPKKETKPEVPKSGLLKWITPSNVRTLKGHTKQVNTVAFSPDGTMLATGADGLFARDNTVRLWNVADGKPLRTLEAQRTQVECVVFLPDGSTLISAAVDVWLWRVSDGARFPRFEKVLATGLALSQDGSILASVPPLWSSEKNVQLWRTASGEHLKTLESHEAEYGVKSLAFSPDGETLAGISGSTIILWRVSDGKVLPSFGMSKEDAAGRCVAFSPDRSILATGGTSLCIWRVSDRKLLHKLRGEKETEYPDIDHGVHSLAFSPDGAIIGTAHQDKMVRLWYVADGKLVHTLSGHQKKVNSVAFSPNGTMLASASDDQTVRLWLVAYPKK